MFKKKIWANFQRVIEVFTQKIVSNMSLGSEIRPGSGKNLFRIQDPGALSEYADFTVLWLT